MSQNKKDELLAEASALMSDDVLTEALADNIIKLRGGLGFLLGMLKKRPGTFNPYILKGVSIYHETKALDRKTVELVAVASAVAMRCEHCLEAHIDSAVAEGASMDEVLDTILVAGAISESSTLSVAMRKYKQAEGKYEKKDKK